MNRAGTEASEAAQELWDLWAKALPTNVLSIVPTTQQRWEFPDDDRFLFDRREAAVIVTFDDWTRHLGITPVRFALTAEVTNSDWTTLVRQEAVRQQKPFNSGAFGNSNTLHPACHANWDGETWSVTFDEIPWLVVKYEDAVHVRRPSMEDVEDQLFFSLAEPKPSYCLNTPARALPRMSASHGKKL